MAITPVEEVLLAAARASSPQKETSDGKFFSLRQWAFIVAAVVILGYILLHYVIPAAHRY